MYDKIGKKIKVLAKIIFVIGAIASVIIGLAILSGAREFFGALILFCGPIIAWISSWLIYGFGEIIDKLCDIEQNTRAGKTKTKIKETVAIAPQNAAEKVKIDKATPIKCEATFERDIDNIEFIDIECPNCHEKLSFEKGTSEWQCPFCDYKFNIDQ